MKNVQERAHNSTGDLLKTLRKDKNYTLQAVADAIGCSPSYLHRLENNSRKNPSIRVAADLAQFYGIEASLLTGEKSEALTRMNVINDTGLRSDILAEVETAITLIKEGLSCIESAPEISRQKLIDAQKSLLYIQSLL